MKIKNRWKIILLATLFNLTWEYSARGLGGIFKPVFLPFILFGFYFTCFTMLEDLIVRSKLKNYQLVLAAFLYGIFPIAFGSRDLFKNPQFLGINWLNLFYIGFLWWGILQTLFAFYFANRLVRRDWQHPRMSRLGWSLAIGYNLVVFLIFQFSKPPINKPPLVSYFVFGLIAIVTAIFLWQDIKKTRKREPWNFEPSPVLDFLSFGSLILFLSVGTFVSTSGALIYVASSFFNPLAIRIGNIWTIIYTIIFLAYRFLVRRKEITV